MKKMLRIIIHYNDIARNTTTYKKTKKTVKKEKKNQWRI